MSRAVSGGVGAPHAARNRRGVGFTLDVARECRMGSSLWQGAAHAAIAEVRHALKSAVDDTQAKLASETQDIGHQVHGAFRFRAPAGVASRVVGCMLRCRLCHARCRARVECSCTE
jgi:hypothetical protein